MIETKKQNVLVTGVSGYLGTSLVKQLLRNDGVDKIYGTDINEPTICSERFIFEKIDVRDGNKHLDILRKNEISQVFHLAFVMGEVRDLEKAIAVNVGGTKAIIEAANQADSVKRIVITASISAYGANKSNKLFIKENEPLKACTLKYGISKRIMEEEVEKIRGSLRKDLELAMLRICTVVGPTDRNGGAVETFLNLPFGFSIIGHDCPVQFVHEEDLLNILERIFSSPSFFGAYNVAPREFTTIREISKRLGKGVVPIPYSVLYGLFYVLFRVKPSIGVSENSVSYLAYPIVVDSCRIEKELGVSFKYSSLDAFMSCANALAASKTSDVA
jgi:nucleoside-diphosphate-sugar epimerase